jgi:hypothetical protein
LRRAGIVRAAATARSTGTVTETLPTVPTPPSEPMMIPTENSAVSPNGLQPESTTPCWPDSTDAGRVKVDVAFPVKVTLQGPQLAGRSRFGESWFLGGPVCNP